MTRRRSAGRPAARRSRTADRIGRRALAVLPPLVVAVVALVRLGGWGSGQVGTPLSRRRRASSARSPTRAACSCAAGWRRSSRPSAGLAIGTALGLVVAFAAARWVDRARHPPADRDRREPPIPLIALAPILNNWFGLLNPLSKMVMAALLVFFPIFVSVTRGLVEVSPAALELMRSYATSDTEVLRKVRVPNMLPFFFTALKVGSDARVHRRDRRRSTSAARPRSSAA